jgi:hypothetical protein
VVVSEPVKVPLAGGLHALVDAADGERCLAFSWHTKRRANRPSYIYATRTVRVTPGRGGKKTDLSLHRFVMGCEPGDGQVVDHINGDPLDCRRENLRLTDHRGNATNVTSSKNQKAGGYKGVAWNPRAKKWQASICAGEVKANGKRRQLYLGCFTDPVAAARAYDAAATKHFGDFASLNFPGWFGPAEPPSAAADFTHLQSDLGGVAT